IRDAHRRRNIAGAVDRSWDAPSPLARRPQRTVGDAHLTAQRTAWLLLADVGFLAVGRLAGLRLGAVVTAVVMGRRLGAHASALAVGDAGAGARVAGRHAALAAQQVADALRRTNQRRKLMT